MTFLVLVQFFLWIKTWISVYFYCFPFVQSNVLFMSPVRSAWDSDHTASLQARTNSHSRMKWVWVTNRVKAEIFYYKKIKIGRYVPSHWWIYRHNITFPSVHTSWMSEWVRFQAPATSSTESCRGWFSVDKHRTHSLDKSYSSLENMTVDITVVLFLFEHPHSLLSSFFPS